MDSVNSNSGDASHRLGDLFDHVFKSGPQANGADAQGGYSRLERVSDSLRFQRYEKRRKQGDKTKKRVVIDGVIRYADKPYSSKRPRPLSPEYLAFKEELRRARQLKELF